MSRFFAAFVVFISACGVSIGLMAAEPGPVKVLTSIKPLQLIAAAVQDGVGSPDVLLPPGASPHHYALRPSDMRRLGDADLFYWIGPQMENFLERPLQTRSKPTVVIASVPGLTLRHFSADSASHEDADEHDHDDGDEHDHDHAPGSLDEHLWLSTANARVIASRMAADLSQADPAHAARYQANAKAFASRLDTLDVRLKAQLAPVAGKPYFVFHEAFDYFEDAYGLKHAGVFTAGAEVQPGAQRVAAMRERLQAAGKSCVFYEPPARPKLADTLTAGLPVKLAQLDALGGFGETTAQGYEQLLGTLGDDLAGCLGSL